MIFGTNRRDKDFTTRKGRKGGGLARQREKRETTTGLFFLPFSSLRESPAFSAVLCGPAGHKNLPFTTNVGPSVQRKCNEASSARYRRKRRISKRVISTSRKYCPALGVESYAKRESASKGERLLVLALLSFWIFLSSMERFTRPARSSCALLPRVHLQA